MKLCTVGITTQNFVVLERYFVIMYFELNRNRILRAMLGHFLYELTFPASTCHIKGRKMANPGKSNTGACKDLGNIRGGANKCKNEKKVRDMENSVVIARGRWRKI